MTAVTCGNLRVEIVSNAGIGHARARQAAAAKAQSARASQVRAVRLSFTRVGIATAQSWFPPACPSR